MPLRSQLRAAAKSDGKCRSAMTHRLIGPDSISTVTQEQRSRRVLGDRAVVGDQHDGQPVGPQARGSRRGSRRRSWCRGFRSVRRPAGSPARWRAPARSPRAAVRRRRAATGSGRRGRPSPTVARAARARGSRSRPCRDPVGNIAISTFCFAVSVGIRLNCWKMKPMCFRRSSASSGSSESSPTATPQQLDRCRQSAGRASRSAAAACSCRSRTGPRSRRTRPWSIVRSMPRRASTVPASRV